jgi:hypothetical protein
VCAKVEHNDRHYCELFVLQADAADAVLRMRRELFSHNDADRLVAA